MARIKLVYIGGGSTRAAGTMASFMHNGADFDGSEVVLVDLDPERLELIRTLAEKMAKARGLDTDRLQATMVGLNRGCWSVEHSYDGEDPLPLFEAAWERRSNDPSLEPQQRRQLQLAVRMGSIPADYFMYYYFRDEILAELS